MYDIMTKRQREAAQRYYNAVDGAIRMLYEALCFIRGQGTLCECRACQHCEQWDENQAPLPDDLAESAQKDLDKAFREGKDIHKTKWFGDMRFISTLIMSILQKISREYGMLRKARPDSKPLRMGFQSQIAEALTKPKAEVEPNPNPRKADEINGVLIGNLRRVLHQSYKMWSATIDCNISDERCEGYKYYYDMSKELYRKIRGSHTMDDLSKAELLVSEWDKMQEEMMLHATVERGAEKRFEGRRFFPQTTPDGFS